MKEQHRTEIKLFINSISRHKMKIMDIPQKLGYEKFYVLKKKFTKNLLPKKRKENMQTKQP